MLKQKNVLSPRVIKIPKKKLLFGYIIGRYDSRRHICYYHTTNSVKWMMDIKKANIFLTNDEVQKIVYKNPNKHKYYQHFVIKCVYKLKKSQEWGTYNKNIPSFDHQTKIHPFQHIQLLVNKI